MPDELVGFFSSSLPFTPPFPPPPYSLSLLAALKLLSRDTFSKWNHRTPASSEHPLLSLCSALVSLSRTHTLPLNVTPVCLTVTGRAVLRGGAGKIPILPAPTLMIYLTWTRELPECICHMKVSHPALWHKVISFKEFPLWSAPQICLLPVPFWWANQCTTQEKREQWVRLTIKSHPSKLKQFSEVAHLGVKSDRCVCLYVCVSVCIFHSQRQDGNSK